MTTKANEGQGILRHYSANIAFITVHLLCFAAIWTGVSWGMVALCMFLYVLRMFGVTGGYHRYFSHRSFKTSRVFQFLLAFLAMTSAQRGVLWWASHHRHHHKHSDQEDDVHSPVQEGFWWSHVGWILTRNVIETDEQRVKDLMRFPELVWLEKYFVVPPIVMGTAVTLLFGWQGLVVGFFWSTVLLWHGTFTINSLCHVIGSRRYETTDDSRNNFWLALITLGEGWHNNHHHYQSSTRQGFFWWEVDITWYVLKMMSWVGLVWDLREPPRHVVLQEENPRRLERLKQSVKDSLPSPPPTPSSSTV